MSHPVFGSSTGADARRLGYVTQLGNGRVRRSLGTDIETGRHHHLLCQLTCRHQVAAPTGSLGISTAYRRVLYRPGPTTHTLRYGAVSTDHHHRLADDLLCRRGCSGPAIRRPPDASLALGDRNYLPAIGWRCLLAAARPAPMRSHWAPRKSSPLRHQTTTSISCADFRVRPCLSALPFGAASAC